MGALAAGYEVPLFSVDNGVRDELGASIEAEDDVSLITDEVMAEDFPEMTGTFDAEVNKPKTILVGAIDGCGEEADDPSGTAVI